jgi:hypothetical protein
VGYEFITSGLIQGRGLREWQAIMIACHSPLPPLVIDVLKDDIHHA